MLSYTEPEEMIPVYADPDRLRQVFINIMDNAIKYSAPGGRITVKLWAGEYKAFIEFIDQGRGIPPEDLENVKTKFYKGSNSVRGSGIGLALVDSIMTALDGTMDIKVPWAGARWSHWACRSIKNKKPFSKHCTPPERSFCQHTVLLSLAIRQDCCGKSPCLLTKILAIRRTLLTKTTSKILSYLYDKIKVKN